MILINGMQDFPGLKMKIEKMQRLQIKLMIYKEI